MNQELANVIRLYSTGSHQELSATFDYKHYIGCKRLKVIYLLPKADLVRYKDFIANKFYQWLEQRAQ